MKLFRRAGFIAVFFLAASGWGEGFLTQLSPEQRQRLGLDLLTPTQLADLEAAVESYRKTGEVAAAKQADSGRRRRVGDRPSRAIRSS